MSAERGRTGKPSRSVGVNGLCHFSRGPGGTIRVAGERRAGGASAPRPQVGDAALAMVSQRKPMRSRRAASVAWQSSSAGVTDGRAIRS